jgi:hypothetical protein
MLEYTLSLARDLAYIWPRGPHQYYLCATPPSENIRKKRGSKENLQFLIKWQDYPEHNNI